MRRTMEARPRLCCTPVAGPTFIVGIGDDSNLSQTYEELDGADQVGELLDRHLSGMMTQR